MVRLDYFGGVAIFFATGLKGVISKRNFNFSVISDILDIILDIDSKAYILHDDICLSDSCFFDSAVEQILNKFKEEEV